MSVVYHAQQMRPQRQAAVKILLPNVPSNSQVYNEFLARFLREADVIATLDHHNIIPIFECDLQDGLAYLVMPYLTGGNLADVLRQRGKLSPQEALKYVTEAAEALDYAHSQGIIHRDLKPSNFLLHGDGHLVLADFGIATIMQDRSNPRRVTLTISGTILGTPEYIAPEIALGKAIDHRADIYELGIVLFQMLTGDLPFKGHTSYEIMMRQINEQLPLLHSLDRLIPMAVDDVLQKATAKHRDERYNSAKEMALELAAAIQHPPFYRASHYAPTVPVNGYLSTDKTVPFDVYDAGQEARPVANIQPGPHRPTSPKKHRLRSKMVLVLGLALFALLVGIAIPALQAPLPQSDYSSGKQSPVSRAQQARDVVQRYYNALNQWDYQTAFNLRELNNYCAFVNGYEHTEHDDITIGNATLQQDGTYLIPVTIKATERIASGTALTIYQVAQIVGKVNGTWKILPGGSSVRGQRILLATNVANLTPTAQASNVVQQFYNYLNQGDYPAAYYQLYGTDSEASGSTRYCQFLNAYPRSKHYQITQLQSTQLADGTIQVVVNVNETQPGTPIVSYQKTYILVQESNSQWKIASGTPV
jgi:serine/threonine-protein kinase